MTPGRADSLSAEDILKRYIEARKANLPRARQYTLTNKETHIFFDGKGEEKSRSSKTFDVIFLEGDTYKKLIARDDKPLSVAEAAKVEKELQKTADERREQRKRQPMMSRSITTASDEDLLKLFTCKVTGEEQIKQSKTWVIQCDPQAGRVAANAREKEKLTTSRQLWIDETQYALMKFVDTALEGNPLELPGSTTTVQFALINNDAWMQTSLVIDGHLHFAKFIKPKVRTEYVNSNFKKFDVQSTVTPQ
jgi:hypothetical protein